MPEADIKSSFANMRRAVDTFIKKRNEVPVNLRQIISDTSFYEESKDNCTYYVVHIGEKDNIRGQKDNEIIYTGKNLETIYKSVETFSVPKELIKTDQKNNILFYENTDESEGKYKAYLVNVNAYDLAMLCKKYYKSEIGRNILFGQNLRDALTKGSKTYEGMTRSIDEEPTNFWYFNNGITIITEKMNLIEIKKDADYLELTNFSIINGAQTTSTFAKYLEEAERDGKTWKKDNLRKVYVAARIVETKENKDLSKNITIYNNTQNPITSRDMVSNNDEQIKIQKKFQSDSDPKIFIELRRGVGPGNRMAYQKHQIISNDELAQLVFASFLANPFTAKDKKNSLFNRDNSTTEFEINREYYQVFNFSEDPSKQGELFRRSKDEINELLFIKFLHNKSKKYLKDNYNKKIEINQNVLDDTKSDESSRKSATRTLELLKKLKQINNINTFYNITLYYQFKWQFDKMFGSADKKYDYNKFYGKDKNYENDIVKSFADIFSATTIEIIKELGLDDPAKFVRDKKSQTIFLDKLTDKLSINTDLQEKYEDFINKYKI